VTTCLCPSCCDSPEPTYTAEFMRACEARSVVRMPDLEARREYLELVEKKRGAAGRRALEVLVQDEWDKMRRVE
jgi:hypothetical protein